MGCDPFCRPRRQAVTPVSDSTHARASVASISPEGNLHRLVGNPRSAPGIDMDNAVGRTPRREQQQQRNSSVQPHGAPKNRMRGILTSVRQRLQGFRLRVDEVPVVRVHLV